MKEKIILSRQYINREYAIYSEDRSVLLNHLCPILIRKWFGLKKQIPIGKGIEGILEVKFTPTKGKKK